MSNRNWGTLSEGPTPSQYKIIERFAKAILAQESKHLKAYLKLIFTDQIGSEDSNSIVWMLANESRLARLNPRLRVMATILHGFLWKYNKVPDDLYTPDSIAIAMLGPLLPTTVTKALRYTEHVWFPEIKRTYLQYAARFNPANLKEMADAINYFVWVEPFMVGNAVELKTFRPLWKLCRGGH